MCVHVHRNCFAIAGDVEVFAGPRYLRVSPEHGSMFIDTHFAEISINAQTCELSVRRGMQCYRLVLFC